jgi:hypothetical protein
VLIARPEVHCERLEVLIARSEVHCERLEVLIAQSEVHCERLEVLIARPEVLLQKGFKKLSKKLCKPTGQNCSREGSFHKGRGYRVLRSARTTRPTIKMADKTA